MLWASRVRYGIGARHARATNMCDMCVDCAVGALLAGARIAMATSTRVATAVDIAAGVSLMAADAASAAPSPHTPFCNHMNPDRQ